MKKICNKEICNKEICIKRYNLEFVREHNKILFNTNNHYNEKEIPQPSDYKDVLSKGHTKNWIDKFHENNYHKIVLDAKDLRWMKNAFRIGVITKKFSHLYDDELEYTCAKYEVPDGKWFIRTDRVSLKEGIYGIGPYDSLEKIIKSMCTTGVGHECFLEDDVECNIYFMKWMEVDPDKEFRVFVYQNEITAISVQHLYSVNNWLNTLTDEQIATKVNKILEFFDTNIRDKMAYMSNYTMDLALIGDDERPYFIEPNSFGKYYAAGSSLYHWINDDEKLHNSDTIEFRYVNE